MLILQIIFSEKGNNGASSKSYKTFSSLWKGLFYIYRMNMGFPKKEKLKSRKLLEQVFAEGKSSKSFPLKLLFIPLEKSDKNLAAFAVPKRNFKNAVRRNRLKRQMREAYRLQKGANEINSQIKYALVFIYLGQAKLPYSDIEKAVRNLLRNLYRQEAH